MHLGGFLFGRMQQNQSPTKRLVQSVTKRDGAFRTTPTGCHHHHLYSASDSCSLELDAEHQMRNAMETLRLVLVTSTFFIVHHQSIVQGQLASGFYANTCPQVESVVLDGVRNGLTQDSRLAASLLRLEFHDCFVNGCDGSILLDDTSTFTGEKRAAPNQNSVRGFQVIDQIKSQLELQCPSVVSCADILAIAARDSVGLSGGPSWNVLLGRRDSLSASKSAAEQSLPTPASDVPTLISKFRAVGLSALDMVTLSGAHTIGLAKCSSFNNRLSNFSNGQPDITIESDFLSSLQQLCPNGVTETLAPLDVVSATTFDSNYYSNLRAGRGLLQSDQVLYSKGGPIIHGLVDVFSSDEISFFASFARSMINLQNIAPLTGSRGEIRSNCRFSN